MLMPTNEVVSIMNFNCKRENAVTYFYVGIKVLLDMRMSKRNFAFSGNDNITVTIPWIIGRGSGWKIAMK